MADATKTNTTKTNRGGELENYSDSWFLSLFLPKTLRIVLPPVDFAGSEGAPRWRHSLPIMWPFRCDEWIVATEVASMAWCLHNPDGCPFIAQALDRPLGSVRLKFEELREQWRGIPEGAWVDLMELRRSGNVYRFEGMEFDRELIGRFRSPWLRARVSAGPGSESLYVRWGASGGGVILALSRG